MRVFGIVKPINSNLRLRPNPQSALRGRHHYRQHFRGCRFVAFHMTKPTLKHIYSYVIIYQTLIICLSVYPCVQGY